MVNDDNLAFRLGSFIENSLVILDTNDIYNKLKEAFNNHVTYIVCNGKIDFLLPMVSVLVNDDTSIIRPRTPVYYMIKDNKIAQHVKTRCHQMDVSFTYYKKEDELFKGIKEWIA